MLLGIKGNLLTYKRQFAQIVFFVEPELFFDACPRLEQSLEFLV